MKASVVVPVYNMPRYVGECISSVLRQTLQDFEVVVVDDGSTDNTAEVVKGFTDHRVRLIQLPKNSGVSAALNVGIKAAQGDYICPLGADDLLEPWMLEKQSEYLDNHDVAAVFGIPLPITDTGEPMEYIGKFAKPSNRSRTEWMATLLEGNTLMGQTMLYRRALHDTLGYWDESLSSANDIDFFIRIVKEHDIYVQHIPMAKVRMRDDASQLSADSTEHRRGFFRDMDYIREKHKPNAKLDYSGKLIIYTGFQNRSSSSDYINGLLASVRCLEKLGVEWDWWGGDAIEDANRAKNSVCARFLEDSTATDLLFVGCNQYWNPLAIIRVLMHEEDIVGGSFFRGKEWSAVISKKAGVPQGRMKNGSPLLKAESLSSEFMRVKKSALKKFRDGYPHLRYKEPMGGMADDYYSTLFFENSFGEKLLNGDQTFSSRWLALGGELWIEPQIEFKTTETVTTQSNLDHYFRDLKEQQTQLKAA